MGVLTTEGRRSIKTKKANLRVLISGASGMLGSSAFEFLNQRHPTLDLFAFSRDGQILHPTRELKGESAKLEFDAVLHAASPASPRNHANLDDVLDANGRLTLALLNLVKPGGVFIYVSSGEVYGGGHSMPIDEKTPVDPVLSGPRSYYPIAKLLGETFCQQRRDIRTVIFRLFHTFGPGMRRGDGRSFADFIWEAVDSGLVTLKSNGNAIRSFMHSADFALAVELAIFDSNVRGVYNVGSSEPCTIREFAIAVCEATGARLAEEGKSEFESSPNHCLYPNTTKLEKHGWSVTRDVEQTILETVDWARAQSPEP